MYQFFVSLLEVEGVYPLENMGFKRFICQACSTRFHGRVENLIVDYNNDFVCIRNKIDFRESFD